VIVPPLDFGLQIGLRDSYQGMPSGMPQPHDPQVRLQPLLAYGQGRRLKPVATSAVDGIAEAMR
jgi:hypothetical protein